MIYRNPEHYEDPTAGKALENLEKEGWEYNKARYQALLRESAGMIEKMKRNGTWPTKKPKPKGSGGDRKAPVRRKAHGDSCGATILKDKTEERH